MGGRERGKAGDFQRTKRLLAASAAGGGGEGESPAAAPAGVGEKHKKHKKSTGSLCFISLETSAPSQARPTGAAGQKAPLLLLPEARSRRGSSILTPWGDIWGG